MGKTSIALAAILRLRELGFPHRTLVLAPKTVCLTTWMTEPKRWRQFEGLRVGLAYGPKVREAVVADQSLDVVVTNYDALPWLAPLLGLPGHGFGVLLCDEITALKNTQSKRFKLLRPILGTFKFRWGLTGTPAANGLLDLFGQVYVLDQGRRLGRFITHFRYAYCVQDPYNRFNYTIPKENAKRILAKLEDLAMYVDEKEWLDLPDLLHVPLEVILDKKTEAQYQGFRQNFILMLAGGAVTSANAGVHTMKLRQVTGGAVYTEWGQYARLGTEKLDRLDDLVEEMAWEPLLVAYNFDHEAERILERHPDALVIKGGMTPTKVQEAVERWNTGAEPLMLVQPSAAALGLNLQFGGCAVCWFSLTYNLLDFIQLNKRLHRSGQQHAVRCYMLIARGTIDEKVSKVLTMKDAVQQQVFDALTMDI